MATWVIVCDRCNDLGKVGWFWRRNCPKCGGDPKWWQIWKHGWGSPGRCKIVQEEKGHWEYRKRS